jgi:dihydrofolate synthase / folylpolyglutamate synthase
MQAAGEGSMQSLSSWLYILENTPHFPDTPAPERIEIMQARLHVKKDFFIITIAGTNGKGTTTHLLSNYYQQQGFTVGRFTSPHLLKFNERIAINDVPVSDAEIVAAFDAIQQAQNDLVLTYFDYSFLAALLIFNEHKINFACLEVGLGGRLDATNALDTDCAVITTIDFDHMQQLGTTREAIGLEKAGIMRPNTPCICGDTDTPKSIIKKAEAVKAQLYMRKQDFAVVNNETSWQLKITGSDFSFSPCIRRWREATDAGCLNYPKHIPLQNAATSFMTIIVTAPLLNLPVNLKIFNELMNKLQVPGRMQILRTHPLVLIDVAHNPQATTYLAKNLEQQQGKIEVIFSALADKDLVELIKPMGKLVDVWHICELNSPRRASIDQLKSAILAVNPKAQIKIIEDIKTTYQNLCDSLASQDSIIIFGSFILINNFFIAINSKTMH